MEIVGSYKINVANILGHGTSAIVYMGHHCQQITEKVAIKRIDKSFLSKAHHVLSKEIAVLKELKSVKHRNIVSFLDCAETSDHVFLIMEYCNGGDLSKYVNESAPLKENIIAVFLQQIASALMALHLKGIVHRDLKPQNILISKSEQQKTNPLFFVLKIADFGFARFLEEGMMAKTLCGTPLYMAPEVLLSSRYDGKADLWSVGAITYQCLTGKAPFCARNQEELKQRYRTNPEIKSRIPSKTSAELSSLLLGLLVSDPNKRIDFDKFFQHEFLTKKPDAETLERRFDSVPLMPTSPASLNSPIRHIHSTFSLEKLPTALQPPSISTKLKEQDSSPKQVPYVAALSSRSASPCLDDFVIVSREEIPSEDWFAPCGVNISSATNRPKRPSDVNLPSTNPVPIPLRERIFRNLTMDHDLQKTSSSPDIRGNRNNSPKDLQAPTSSKALNAVTQRQSSLVKMASAESMSPPSVQFLLGTPSSNSSLSNSPSIVAPSSSLCHHRGSNASHLNLTAQPRQLGFASSSGNSPLHFSNFMNSINSPASPSACVFHMELEPSISFIAPELNEKMLLSKVDVELIERFEFILDLSKCIMQLARVHSNTLSQSLFLGKALPSHDSGLSLTINEKERRLQQIQLYVYVLELLYSVLQLTQEMLKEGRVIPSRPLIRVLSEINDCYQQCLSESKLAKEKITSSSISSSISNLSPNTIHMTERLLFNCAIDLLRNGMSEDVVGNKQDCLQNYRSAYLLLHSLARQALRSDDKLLLDGFRNDIEKRLMNLHTRGYMCVKK